jgi:hypothetical protein
MSFARLLSYTIAVPAFIIVMFFTAWILAAGCSRVHILVTNQSGATLSNLVISGSCKERHADTLAASSEWHTSTPYRSGGLIQFSFETTGQNYTTNSDACLNHSGFCYVWFTIGTNMVITSGAKY